MGDADAFHGEKEFCAKGKADFLISSAGTDYHSVLRRCDRFIFANENWKDRENEETILFAKLVNLDPQKVWFSAKEVAALLGRTDQFVRDLVENQRIMGHALSARGESCRKSYQIHRSALAIYLMKTANYCCRDFENHLLQLLNFLPKDRRDALKKYF